MDLYCEGIVILAALGLRIWVHPCLRCCPNGVVPPGLGGRRGRQGEGVEVSFLFFLMMKMIKTRIVVKTRAQAMSTAERMPS